MMSFPSPFFSHLFAVYLALLVIPAAGAAESSSTYSTSVQQAVKEYNQGNWEVAYAMFRTANEVEPNARTLRGLGLCAFELRLYVESIVALEASLTDPRKPLTPDQRKQVNDMLGQARGFISTYQFRITPQSAELMVDGQVRLSAVEPISFNPGAHVITARAPGYEEQRVAVVARPGTREQLSIELVESREPTTSGSMPATSLSIQRSEPNEKSFPLRRPWTWSLAVGAAVTAGAAVGLRVQVSRLHDQFVECGRKDRQCDVVESRGRNVLLGSRVMGALGGGLAVGALIGFFLEGKVKARTPLLVGPQTIEFHRAF